MQKMNIFSFCNTFFFYLSKLEKVVAVICLSCIVLLITYQVIARSIFHYPLVWAEEISTYLFVWTTFIGASITYKQGSHIVIRTFISKCPPNISAMIQIIVYGIIVYTTILIIQNLLTTVIPTEMKSFSVALPIKLPKAFFFSIPLLFAMCNILVYTLYMIINKVHGITKQGGK